MYDYECKSVQCYLHPGILFIRILYIPLFVLFTFCFKMTPFIIPFHIFAWKTYFPCPKLSEPNFNYRGKYTYIRSSDITFEVPSFKTLMLAANQSMAANLMNKSKFGKSKLIKRKRQPTFLAGNQNLTDAPRKV